MNEITAHELREWRTRQGLTQTELGKIVGWKKLVVTNIETGRRKISEAEQKVLQMIINGAPAIGSHLDASMKFTADEWATMQKMALREGYGDAKAWIVAKIRAYLAQLPKNTTSTPGSTARAILSQTPPAITEPKPPSAPAS